MRSDLTFPSPIACMRVRYFELSNNDAASPLFVLLLDLFLFRHVSLGRPLQRLERLARFDIHLQRDRILRERIDIELHLHLDAVVLLLARPAGGRRGSPAEERKALATLLEPPERVLRLFLRREDSGVSARTDEIPKLSSVSSIAEVRRLDEDFMLRTYLAAMSSTTVVAHFRFSSSSTARPGPVRYALSSFRML